MKIKPLFNYTNATDFLKKYLIANGVDKDKIDIFIEPDDSCYDNASKYRNMEEASLRLDMAIRNREKIGVVVDSDADGNTSAAILISFLYNTLGLLPVYFIHTGKQHGLRPTPDESMVDQIVEANVELLFIPDASSEDGQQCKILKQEHDIDTIVIDHHEFDKPNTWAIVVNNQTEGQDVNKALSGCGVTSKFIEYYCQTRGFECPYMTDMVACSLVSDSMNLSSLENRAYIYNGLDDIRNPLLKEMTKLNRRGNTPNGFSFGLIPPINALQRSSEQDDKAIFFEALVGQGDIEKAVKAARKAHKEQLNTVKTMTEEIEPTLDVSKKAIIGFTEADNKEYIGLVANKIQSKYNKPTILLREANSTTWSGSLRSPVPLKDVINDSGLAVCQGHACACGCLVKKSNLHKLIDFLDTLDLDVEPEIEVACELKPKNISVRLCKQVEENNLMWGQGLPKPQFYVKARVNSGNVQVFKKKTITIKLTIDGISFIMFFAKEEDVEAFTKLPEYEIELIVEVGTNEWNNIVSPQALIQSYEIRPVEEENWKDLF